VHSQLIAESISVARTSGKTLQADLVSISVEQSYEIQWINTAKRIKAGEDVIGWKLGYVSEVMRRSMGISQPN
jgi:2-keto-4-pentenoate hydratase